MSALATGVRETRSTADSSLDDTQIHDVLRNERRQLALRCLRDSAEPLSVRELSERVAALETGESPPPRKKRQSVYVSLLQTHLPKLDDLDIVRYVGARDAVTLAERAEEVSVYMEAVPRYGLSFSEYYAGLSLLGLLLVAASSVGVPVVSGIGAVGWTTAVLVCVFASAVYQTVRQGSSLFHRLRSG